jgi:hypothetical protein
VSHPLQAKSFQKHLVQSPLFGLSCTTVQQT